MKNTPKKQGNFVNKQGRKPFNPAGKRDERRDEKRTFKPDFRKTGDSRPDKPVNSRLNPEHCLFGIHPVKAALENKNRTIVRIRATENAFRNIEASFNPKIHPQPQICERNDIDSLLPPDAVHQGIVIDVKPLEETFLSDILIRTQNDDKLCLVILDHVTDPHNVGAVMRSASAFGAKAVIVHKRYAPQITATLAKSAVGAVEYVPLVSVVNLAQAMDEIKKFNIVIIGFDEDGTDTLGNYKIPGRTSLVMGAEGDGMRELTGKKCDIILKLPTNGPIGSLNVSNAAAIALYETVR